MTASPPRNAAAAERYLVLLRHAKSSWGDPSRGDRERPLNTRGREAGRLLAGWFAERAPPDLVLCSDALRTRQTLEAIAAAFPRRPKAQVEKRLYLASPAALLERIAAVPDEVHRLLVIGHNPGMHELAALLAAPAPQRRRAPLERKFPTGALASYRFAGPWRDIAEARPTLTEFLTPEMLAAE
jgi:phosphohistidine phosphatase